MQNPEQNPEQNNCADLLNDEKYASARELYQSLLNEGKDPFAHMLQMQHDLQKAVAQKNPDVNPDPDEL